MAEQDATDDLEAARAARRARDLELTPLERLEKLDAMLRAAHELRSLPKKER